MPGFAGFYLSAFQEDGYGMTPSEPCALKDIPMLFRQPVDGIWRLLFS